jgi:hypothetical protein
MSAVLRVTGEDLQYLSSQLTALAEKVHSFPFRGVGGMPSCGSPSVAAAGDSANDHFELRSLLIETELRALADMAWHVNETMGAQDSSIAGGTSGGGGGGGGGGAW